jgi:hypothetical protein
MTVSKDVIISKDVLSELPNDYDQTLLGDRRGAKRQYRSSHPSSANLHVREYDDRFTIHIDREDPRTNPSGHLLRDAPETIAAAATAMCFAKRSFNKICKISTVDKRSSKFSNVSLFGNLFLSFAVLNRIFGILKTILFG